MNGALTLRGFPIQRSGKWKTRRFHGRRSITPMKHKGRKPAKTRCHNRNGVQLREHTSSFHDNERQGENKDQHCENQKREGDKDSECSRERKDTEVHEEVIQLGNSEHSEKPVHPGSVQELRELSASVQVTDETDQQEEEPPF